mmetsp:Transcript_53471/g.73052  ORF Transcript_53471/g.73052 Transcript_53471/m.73052 type:complete len:977 (-) Transcript_53471:281-3211(-)|eukprot:CAMPEP_0185774622 /NCGR_PEP_ID=MMETSP1174-20130828/79087_1 /TAXON_ID=35687 /ORGANISM="Dictyocha speculum, Strain CCMP1381" /LENGTH=976 /DNA_ID=CAMNT_0028461893 /DNA_START=222 /DNA_END=3152 /DNA_ORIENTATION=-
MPPKGKGKKKGGGGKKQANTASAAQDDDWAVLNEIEPKKEDSPPDVPTGTPPDTEGNSETQPPPAEKQDAAAAFLAQMGIAEDDGEAKKDNKKKDKKKKGKKSNASKAEDKQPKQTAQGRLVAERLAKQREEEERIRKEEEEEEARIAEEERKIEEEAKRVEDEKQRKKDKAKAKLEAKKKDGTYKTKAQKQKERVQAERLEAMRAAGLLQDVDKDAGKKKKPMYGNKKKGKKAPEKKVEEPQVPAEPIKVEEPEEPDEKQVEAKTEEPEEEEGGDWEDVADDWENASVDKLVIDGGEDEEEDLVEKERREEEKQLKLRAIAKVKRDEELRLQAEERAALETQAAEDASKSEREAEVKKLEARKRRMEREAKEESERSTDRLRSPICCIMGHVDTGKTKLLDKIRRTNVQEGEAGGITQQIGATFFPKETLVSKTEKLNNAIDMDVKLPGLLVIDTPGHEAFSNLRSRGSSLCDIAILVIDLMHGLEQQTKESIEMLRKKRCPFVVALNKVDRCYGWKTLPDMEIRDALAQQDQSTRDEFQNRMMTIRTELMSNGLNAELYWENDDMKSTVSLIPTSAMSGEGVNDMLHMLVRLTQERMSTSLMYSATLQCTVLEVKVIDGLGCSVDVILVNGELNTGAQIVVCTTDGPVVTQIRAILTPPPAKELRIKSQYINHERIEAAIGLKICATGLESAVAGSPIMVVGEDDDVEDIKEEVMRDFSSLVTNLGTDTHGVFAAASTLGALEALLEFLRKECDPPIPVHAVSIGPVFKRDVMKAGLMHQKKKPEYATILAFDVPIDGDAVTLAEELNVKIFTADIIYHLFDHFTRHLAQTLEEEKAKAKNIAVFPCLIKIMPNMVFNQKDPIICGVEVVDGILKLGTPLCIPHNGFIHVGRVTSIENNHQKVERMKKGTQCAIQISNEGNPGMTYGRQFTHEHALYSEISRSSIDALKKYFKDEMTNEEWRLLIKLKTVFSII